MIHRKKITKTNEQWEKDLAPDVYYVCRLQGTEAPYSGRYCTHFEKGDYQCTCCDAPLFSSQTKYKTNCGWPSFYQPITDSALEYREDLSLKERRIEVLCSTCASHLGHVFEDGPEPTGQRYCINSLALKFIPEKES